MPSPYHGETVLWKPEEKDLEFKKNIWGSFPKSESKNKVK